MRRILLFTLVNTVIFHNVSSLNPNVFWKRARSMTKNIGSNVYKRTKTAIIPIVAKIKNTNGGFYEGNSNNNENLGYNDYLQSATRYSNPQQMANQQQHVSDGLYQDYRNSLTETQNYAPAPVYMPPAPAPVYTLTAPQPTPPIPAPTSLYEPPSAYTTPTPAPAPAPPSSVSVPITSQSNNALAMSRYAHTPSPVSASAPPSSVSVPITSQSNNALAMSRYAHAPSNAPGPVSTPAPVPVTPVSTIQKKEYSTEGLYEEYRKSLQKTNPTTENTMSLNTQSVNTSSSYQNTASGFYGGPNKSSNIKKKDTILYEPPAVVKSAPHLGGNKYSDSGFYQGR